MGLKRYPTPFLPKNERKDPLSFGAFYDPVRTPPVFHMLSLSFPHRNQNEKM